MFSSSRKGRPRFGLELETGIFRLLSAPIVLIIVVVMSKDFRRGRATLSDFVDAVGSTYVAVANVTVQQSPQI